MVICLNNYNNLYEDFKTISTSVYYEVRTSVN